MWSAGGLRAPLGRMITAAREAGDLAGEGRWPAESFSVVFAVKGKARDKPVPIRSRCWTSSAAMAAMGTVRAIYGLDAGYGLGSDRGSPNDGRTLFSKRVMALIRSPLRVRT